MQKTAEIIREEVGKLLSLRRKVRFQRIHDRSMETVSSTDTEVVNHVSMWKNRV